MKIQPANFFRTKKVLITLGPTREYFDSVRFISNASSGKMGIALAREFKALGAEVFLVCGPGVILPPHFDFCIAVSAEQMFHEVRKYFPKTDIFVSCAAVSDYRPKEVQSDKIHKDKRIWSVKLVRNTDILASVSRHKKNQLCIGFSLEDSNGLERTKKKMINKNCDLMILNTPESIESNFIRAQILFRNGNIWQLGKINKKKCAQELCRAIIQTVRERQV